MAIPVEETLSLWRELERIRDELPTESLERQQVEQQIAAVRERYSLLTDRAAIQDEPSVTEIDSPAKAGQPSV